MFMRVLPNRLIKAVEFCPSDQRARNEPATGHVSDDYSTLAEIAARRGDDASPALGARLGAHR
jgi:hypothetical protein